MKTLLFIFIASMFAGFINNPQKPLLSNIDEEARTNSLKKKYRSISCSPDLALFNLNDSNNVIPLLTGWGNYRMPVTVSSDSANIYFQQGINMYYGFHIIEALASFEKSVQFDSSFAMGYWGKALSYGPNINDLGYAASPDALVASAKAKELSSNCTSVEKGLIDAMQVRYSDDTTQTREHLNQLYADAMKKLHEQFPTSIDAGVLYADALMVQHPWDLYDLHGNAKEWTPVIVQTLESVLKQSPKHPGASHYYIHAVEASSHPETALAVANNLSSLMPGVSHVVHMPAHIYLRTGYYNKGIDVNRQAIKGYNDYLSKYPAVVNNVPLYLIHNLHMEATCANMSGRYVDAAKASEDCRNSFDSGMMSIPDFVGIYIQYIYMTPFLTLVRFGKWDDILNTPAIPQTYIYANLLWHYGRGVAFARTHETDRANKELEVLQADLLNEQLKAPSPNFANPGINGARVAEKILAGVIAEEQQNLSLAVTLLTDAVVLEDAMTYDEPKDWPHPARQYLGNALLKAKKYTDAEQAFTNDLAINPNNGWSLTGLATAYEKEGKVKESASAKKLAATAFDKSDIKISQAVY